MINKRFLINLVAVMGAFLLNVGLSFVLAPYIVDKLGVAAYGFVDLATNIVNYVGVLTAALNGLIGRYIALAYHKKQYKKASAYFTSALAANVVVSLLVIVVGAVVSANIQHIFEVDSSLLGDVKLTFLLTFLVFAAGLINTVFVVSTFVANRLDIDSVRKMIMALIRTIAVVMLFMLFVPNIYFVPLAALIAIVAILFWNIRLMKRLVPHISIKSSLLKFAYILKLVKNGVWMSVNAFSTVLLTGVDLVLANSFLGSTAMGVLSLAKVVPSALYVLSTYVASVFSPVYAKLYAEDRTDDLVGSLKTSIKILSIIMIPPVATFVVFGETFFSLWQPTLPASTIHMMYVLSLLTLLPIAFNSMLEGLYYPNILTNKIKTSTLVTLGFGIISLLAALLLLWTTDFGLYAIAGVSSVFILARVLFFTPIFCAHILGVHKSTFYPVIARSTMVLIVLTGIMLLVARLFLVNSWLSLLLVGGMFCIAAYVIVSFSIIGRREIVKLNALRRMSGS